MNRHVPPELEARLDRLAAETSRRADQLALELLATSVDPRRLVPARGRERSGVGSGRSAGGPRRGRISNQPAIRWLMREAWTSRVGKCGKTSVRSVPSNQHDSKKCPENHDPSPSDPGFLPSLNPWLKVRLLPGSPAQQFGPPIRHLSLRVRRATVFSVDLSPTA